MKRLSRDISRCVGRNDLTPDSVECPDRKACARYLTIEIDRAAHPDAGYPHSIVTNMRDADGVCRHRIKP